jgi:hypothetical protein
VKLGGVIVDVNIGSRIQRPRVDKRIVVER